MCEKCSISVVEVPTQRLFSLCPVYFCTNLAVKSCVFFCVCDCGVDLVLIPGGWIEALVGGFFRRGDWKLVLIEGKLKNQQRHN